VPRKSSWVLIGYLGLGVLLTWPLVTRFPTHVPGDGIDDPSLAWNLWWLKHALVDQPQNPFLCRWQFWPVGINLAFYTLTILNGLLSIPLQLVFGVVPAYNLLLLSSFVLGGYGTYLLCLEFLVTGRARNEPRVATADRLLAGRTQQWAAFLAGAFYAFASAKMFYAALGQGNIASSQWVPFAGLYLVRIGRPRGTLRDAGLAALFMILQAYAELTFASFLLVLAALVALWSALSSRLPALKALLLRFLAVGILFTLGILPFLANMLPDLRAEGDFFTSGGGFADLFSADLAGYLLPTQLHPLFGRLVRELAHDSLPAADGTHWPVNKGQHIYLGYTALALAVIGWARGRGRPEARFWLLAAGVFFLLTLGPSLRVAGHDTGCPLPFRLLAQLPFFKGNRYPSRYSVMLLVSLAPLVAQGACRALGIWPGQPRSETVASRWPAIPALLLLALLLGEHLSVPLPLFDLRVPKLYTQVADEPGDFALLEIPLGWRNGARVAGKKDIVIMQQLWYQTRHGKRLLGGNTSRNPEFKFQYFSEDPTLARLIALTNAADVPQHEALRAALAAEEISAAERSRARAWAATLNIRYVMVHRDKVPRQAEAALLSLLPLELAGEEGPLALYRVAEELHPPRVFALGSDQGRPVLAEGWSLDMSTGVAYAGRREARLLLPLPAQATQVRFQGWSLAPGQVMSLVVEGQVVGSQPLPAQPGWLTFVVPGDPRRPPLSDVRLRFSALIPVAALGGGPWLVGQSGVQSPVSLLVRSAGEETGDFAHIYVDGVDLAPNERGYNLVALRSEDGQLLAAAAFDTHGDDAAGAQLAAWLGRLPAGTIVAGAVRDEASLRLSQEAVVALQTLGVTTDLRAHFRWGHAFIGVVGAPAGSALEAVDGIRPAQVSLGWASASPTLAAGLAQIAVGK